MRKYIFLLTLWCLLIHGSEAFSQDGPPPPPPSQHGQTGNNPVGGGAPIEGDLMIIGFSLFYLANKLLNGKSGEVLEVKDKISS